MNRTREKGVISIYSKILAIVVLLVSIVYGIGTKCGWWDYLRGRTAARDGLLRIWSESIPGGVCGDRSLREYTALTRLIGHYSRNPEIKRRSALGEAPYCINRFAGKNLPSIKAEYLPKQWPAWEFVPSGLPVVYLYEPKVQGQPSKVDEDAEWVGTLADIGDWIEKDREHGNFWMNTILIGVLSLCVVLLDLKGK